MIIFKLILFVTLYQLSEGTNKLVQYKVYTDQGIQEQYRTQNTIVTRRIVNKAIMCQIECNMNQNCTMITVDIDNGCTLFKGESDLKDFTALKGTFIYTKVSEYGKYCTLDSDCLGCKGFICRSGKCDCKSG